MDGNGARVLKARIESYHWSQAGAVRAGRQPELDPDAELLLECSEGLRVYDDGREKRLVGDAWTPTTFERRDAAA